MMKDEEVLICGPDNLTYFTARLKQALPEFYPVLKEIHQSGLIPGLRGAVLIINPSDNKAELNPVTTENQCQHCAHWSRDTVGDGTGIGQCQLNSIPRLLKYQKQTACRQFKAALCQ